MEGDSDRIDRFCAPSTRSSCIPGMVGLRLLRNLGGVKRIDPGGLPSKSEGVNSGKAANSRTAFVHD